MEVDVLGLERYTTCLEKLGSELIARGVNGLN